MSICIGPLDMGSNAGAAAAPPPADVGTPTELEWAALPSGGVGTCGSGSRMSAPSPRPNAFLGICNYLLSKLRIPLRTFAVYIIENDRLTKARRFRQPHISRNQALK